MNTITVMANLTFMLLVAAWGLTRLTLVDVCTALAILFTIAVVAAVVAVTVVALADLVVERVTGHELLPRDERDA